MKIFGAALLILASLSAWPSYAADTSIFFTGGVLSLSPPKVEITKIYGIKLVPVNIYVKEAGKVTYVSHQIENLGNTTCSVNLEITSVSKEKGWSAELIKDDNGDGEHQAGENTRSGGMIELGEGSVYSFFVKLTAPQDMRSGDTGYAVVTASELKKDGDSYVGYNGVTYGGPDESSSTDTVVIK